MELGRLRRRGGPLAKVALAVLLGSVVAAACGTSGSGSGSGSTTTTGAQAQSSGSGGSISPASVDIALRYTGGTAGVADKSLPPVVVGYANQEGGVPSFPGQTKAAEAAVRFINEKLGGVHGHPVVLDKCLIQAEEDGQKCAAQFLANKHIAVTNLSVAVVGNAPFYSLIGGKLPTIVSVVGAEADYTTPHVYEFDGGGSLTMDAAAADIKQDHARSVAVISSDNPAGKFIISQVLVPKLTAAGIAVKVAYVSDSGTTPDYVSALQSVGATKADAIDLGPATPQGCIAAYQAMQQLGIAGKFGASTYACQGDPVPEALGGGPKGFWIRTLAESPLLDSPQTNAFRDVMKAYGAADAINAGNTQKAFSDLLTINKFANTIGFDQLTPKAFETQITSFAGPAFMVPGPIKCGWLRQFPGICGTATAGSTYKDGKWVAVPDHLAQR